jgi:hypothetical protein
MSKEGEMKKVVVTLSLCAVAAFACTVVGQETIERSPSVIRGGESGHVAHAGLWAGYGSYAGPDCCGPVGCASPCAPAGCSSGVCHGYDNCCGGHCFPGLVCCLKKMGRMLDCLVPCNKCGHGCGGHGCGHGCGLFGGYCKPHLFTHKGCGGCKSCCEPACGEPCPTCSTPVGGPGPTNPFRDDPEPPAPLPEPAQDARAHPLWKKTPAAQTATPTSAQQTSTPASTPNIPAPPPAGSGTPYKVAKTAPAADRFVPFAPKLSEPPKTTVAARPANIAPAEPAPIVTSSRRINRPALTAAPIASQAEVKTKPVAQSVLRRASLEEEIQEVTESPVELMSSPTHARRPPALLPIQLDSEPAPAARPLTRPVTEAIPHNPLRK